MAPETQSQSSGQLVRTRPILNKVQVFFPKKGDFSFARITYYSRTIKNGKEVWTLDRSFGYHFIDNIEDITSLEPQKDNYLKGMLRHPSFFMGYSSYWKEFYVGSLIDVSFYEDRRPFNIEFEFIYDDIRRVDIVMPHTYRTIQTGSFQVGGECNLSCILREMGIYYEPVEPQIQPKPISQPEPVPRIVCNFEPIYQAPQPMPAPKPIQEIKCNFDPIQ